MAGHRGHRHLPATAACPSLVAPKACPVWVAPQAILVPCMARHFRGRSSSSSSRGLPGLQERPLAWAAACPAPLAWAATCLAPLAWEAACLAPLAWAARHARRRRQAPLPHRARALALQALRLRARRTLAVAGRSPCLHVPGPCRAAWAGGSRARRSTWAHHRSWAVEWACQGRCRGHRVHRQGRQGHHRGRQGHRQGRQDRPAWDRGCRALQEWPSRAHRVLRRKVHSMAWHTMVPRAPRAWHPQAHRALRA